MNGESYEKGTEAINIWLYLENSSVKENVECPDVLSTKISLCGSIKESHP